MPGPIMTAAQAKKKYGFKSITRTGDKIKIRNSTGKTVTVGSGSKVYHRGHGKFGLYSVERDANRFSGKYARGHKTTVGIKNKTGADYRQTGVAGRDKGKPHFR